MANRTTDILGNSTPVSNVDMHVHSRYSDRPSQWILRQVGAPECFTEPQFVYDAAKKAGMDFVTISDHNEIRGALELKSKYPNEVFISQEITTYFPDNGCKIHILAWDFTEEQHREIQNVRKSIFDLSIYLKEQKILHSVAHPLYQNNGKLTLDQFEKMILMFKHFEGLNGSRAEMLNAVAFDICRGLTKETIDKLSDRHNMAPQVEEPHVKHFTGGSDDHSSVFIARAHTVVPRVKTYQEFLQNVREGKCTFRGRPGSALTLSHSLYNIAYLYYSDKLKRGSKSGHELMVKVFENFVTGQTLNEFSFGEKLRHVTKKVTTKQKTEAEKELSISAHFSKIIRDGGFADRVADETFETDEVEVRSFKIASQIVNELSYIFVQKLIQKFSEGNILDCLQAVSALGPIGLGAAPYFVAFKHYSKDRKLMMEASQAFLGKLPDGFSERKRAWFTDTIQDVNGVAHTIEKICEVAQLKGRDLQVITSRSNLADLKIPVKNFPPIGEFDLKEYKGIQLAFPPVLNMIEHCWRENFSDIVISTPGPVGLMGLVAGKLLGIPTSGIYHTDFPQYVKVLTGDDRMGSLTWKYMEWFYGSLDFVYVPSEAYRLILLDRGIPAEKLKLMPRGIDCEKFTPEKRDTRFWEMFGANGQLKFLYAGRVSKEKDLDTLTEAYMRLFEEHPNVLLSVVGDGPYLGEMKKKLPKNAAIFTGFLSGDALTRAYASSDVFVFPSTTDTFGNVILEAQASGLPAIVSDEGGPRELVQHGVTGFVTKAKNPEDLYLAMKKFVVDQSLRQQMSQTARARMRERSWDAAFETFWN